MLDKRSRVLGGEPSWIRSNVEIHTHGGTLTSHDWMNLIQSAGDYILADLYPKLPYRMDALYSLLAACNEVLNMVSPADDDNRDEVDKSIPI
jgi:hypothetical protein